MIPKNTIATVLLSIGTLVYAVECSNSATPPLITGKKDQSRQIAQLIAQLASNSYQDRAAATRKLMEIDQALPALREARKNGTLETRQRAERIIAVIEARLAERFIRSSISKVNEEGLDLFLDRMVLPRRASTFENMPSRYQKLLRQAEQAASRPALRKKPQ